MSKKTDMLSGMQITALVSLSIIGVGIMSLPSDIVKTIKVDGVIATALGGGLALTFTAVIAYLGKRFPHQTILDYSKSLVGTILAKMINAVLIIYSLMFAAAVVRTFAVAVKLFLLENTPLEVIILSMLIIVLYLISNGINPIARICEAFFPIIIISFSILLIMSLRNFDIREHYSFWQVDWIQLLKAVPRSGLAYLGFEFLFIAGAFMMEPKRMVRYSLAGTSAAVALYVATVFVSIGVFTADNLEYMLYPTLDLAKTVSFPGGFAERFDIFFGFFWILSAFTTLSIFHYMSAFTTTKLFGFKNYRPFCYLVAPIIYFISLVPQNIWQHRIAKEWLSYLGIVVAGFIPVGLLAVALIRKKGGEKNEEV